MRYEATMTTDVSATTLRLSESCHTDSTPLVSEIFFNNAEFNVASVGFALGCLVLTRRFVGEQVEFASAPLGIEAAQAARALLPQLISAHPVNGMDRGQSTGELDIVCTPARQPSIWVESTDQVPIVPIDWSGDFVDPATRTSEGFRLGRIVTNAGLIADETSVSIAIGLMYSGKRCRSLHVRAASGAQAAEYEPICEALAMVGIALHVEQVVSRRSRRR